MSNERTVTLNFGTGKVDGFNIGIDYSKGFQILTIYLGLWYIYCERWEK